MYLFFNEFIVSVQGSPDAETGLGVYLFDGVVDAFDCCAVRVSLVGAAFRLFLIASHLSVGFDVGFLYHTERTDDGEWHLTHLQARRHGVETSLEGEIHQCRMDEVVLMVAEGYLVAAEFLCEVEELLAAVPGAEEAGLLLTAEAGGGGGLL